MYANSLNVNILVFLMSRMINHKLWKLTEVDQCWETAVDWRKLDEQHMMKWTSYSLNQRELKHVLADHSINQIPVSVIPNLATSCSFGFSVNSPSSYVSLGAQVFSVKKVQMPSCEFPSNYISQLKRQPWDLVCQVWGIGCNKTNLPSSVFRWHQ